MGYVTHKRWHFFLCALGIFLYHQVCSGRKVRILVVSTKNCGIQMVNLALSHSGCRTHIKAYEFFSRTSDGLGLYIDGIYTLFNVSVVLQ